MRSPPAPASRAARSPLEPLRATRRRADDPRARDLPRLRGDLEGADAPAHAADVGHERDPRHRHRRRDARRRHGGGRHAHRLDRLRRDDPRRRERRGRLRRDRSNARDVQEARAAAEGRRSRMSQPTSNLLYLITIVCFILALRFLSSPTTARRGNWIGAAGMVVAIVVTLFQPGLHVGWRIPVGGAIGAAFGAVGARRVKMAAMPQMVALFNGVGGGAAALVSLAEFHNLVPEPGRLHGDVSLAIVAAALIGSVSFAGSMVAFAKLQELVRGRPITYPGQQYVNLALFTALVAIGIAMVAGAEQQWLIVALIVGALVFGVLFVLPIGGADMPVVISLLNAFTGLATSATGFEVHSYVLIVSGALVGASGTLLTILMGRAMNRSIGNVLFGAFGKVAVTAGAAAAGADGASVRSTTADDVAVMLAYAKRVVVVPGYGLAVAQAQHDVRQ